MRVNPDSALGNIHRAYLESYTSARCERSLWGFTRKQRIGGYGPGQGVLLLILPGPLTGHLDFQNQTEEGTD